MYYILIVRVGISPTFPNPTPLLFHTIIGFEFKNNNK